MGLVSDPPLRQKQTLWQSGQIKMLFLSKYAGFSYLDMLHPKLSSNTLFMAIYHCVHGILVQINISLYVIFQKHTDGFSFAQSGFSFRSTRDAPFQMKCQIHLVKTNMMASILVMEKWLDKNVVLMQIALFSVRSCQTRSGKTERVKSHNSSSNNQNSTASKMQPIDVHTHQSYDVAPLYVLTMTLTLSVCDQIHYCYKCTLSSHKECTHE